eukprot:TRINITY_DN22753_c0_g1_i1.p1 TRINITY_DN22753_c0_g1~~TRINITY_DN22753_c0_g1_i1.p1  ORF type:complete len:205 (+),score=30.04 TRINITY_DN22753_c0_g1_i1:43-657(+)
MATVLKPNQDAVVKILMVGESGAGKSSLLLRYTDNTFSEEFASTIGVDFKFKQLWFDGKKIRLQLWDTAGQERFQTVTASFYRGAHGVMLVYDLTNYPTFRNVDRWLHEIRKFASEKVVIQLVGNKSDMAQDRVVDFEEAKQTADANNMLYIETSAKKNVNIDAAFEALAKAAITALGREKMRVAQVTQTMDLSHQRNQSSCGC